MSKELDILNALLKHGTFVAASEELGVTQSYVSQCLRRLEDAYGVQVIDRSTKPLRLTDIGEKIYASLEVSHEQELRLKMMCADYCDLKVGQVRVGSNSERTSVIFPQAVAKFNQKYPGIRLNFVSENHLEEICTLHSQGKVDVGICFESLLTEEVDAYPLYRERYLLALPRNNETEKIAVRYGNRARCPILGKTHGTVVSRYPLIQTPNHTERLKIISATVGAELKASLIEARTVRDRLSFVAAGCGSAVLQESLIESNSVADDCVYLSLEKVLPVQTVVIAWAKKYYRSKASKIFCQELKQYYSKIETIY